MPTQLFVDRVAALYGQAQSLTEASLRGGFASGDESWVFAHPPPLATVLALLRRHLQDATRSAAH